MDPERKLPIADGNEGRLLVSKTDTNHLGRLGTLLPNRVQRFGLYPSVLLRP